MCIVMLSAGCGKYLEKYPHNGVPRENITMEDAELLVTGMYNIAQYKPTFNGWALFDLIGGYRMQILLWEGDDEFPPNAQVLYSDNFAAGFAAEDRVVAGDILISTIRSFM